MWLIPLIVSHLINLHMQVVMLFYWNLKMQGLWNDALIGPNKIYLVWWAILWGKFIIIILSVTVATIIYFLNDSSEIIYILANISNK